MSIVKKDVITNYSSIHPYLVGKPKPSNTRLPVPEHQTCTFCLMAQNRDSVAAFDGSQNRSIIAERATAFIVPNKYSLFSHNSNLLAITDAHHSSIEDLSLSELEDLFTILQQKYINTNPSPFSFINIGLQAGGSNPHLHAQLVSTPFPQAAPLSSLKKHSPLLKDIQNAKESNLIIKETSDYTVYIPPSPTVSGEIRITAKSLQTSLQPLLETLSSISKKYQWAYNLIPFFTEQNDKDNFTVLYQWLPRFDQGTIYQLYFQAAVQSINSNEYADMIRATL